MNISELKAKLKSERAAEWTLLPDIALYMDQVISYMQRQLIDFGGGERLTAAMVNNYIKQGLLPRADGKRYNHEHIAYLTAISVFKQVLPVLDTKLLIEKNMLNEDISDFYTKLRLLLDSEFTKLSELLPEEMNEEEISHTALECAVNAYAQQYLCKRLIEMLDEKKEK